MADVPATPKKHRMQFRTREGHEFRHINGLLHSENDQPALTYANGTKWWYHKGKVQREGGPAVVFPNGTEEWWMDNRRHRAGGPAVTYPVAGINPDMRGVKQWWTQGRLIKEELPPAVRRYRALVAQAYKTCFGSGR